MVFIGVLIFKVSMQCIDIMPFSHFALERVSLCNHGWPRIHYVDWFDRDPLACASSMLGLKVFTPTLCFLTL